MHLIDKCVITLKDDNSIMVQSYGFDEKTKSAVQLVGDQANLNCLIDQKQKDSLESIFKTLS